MSDPQMNPRDPVEPADLSKPDQGMLDRALCWVRENWNEDSNLGKARLATVAVLVFLFVLTLWPAQDAELPVQAQVDISAPPVVLSERAVINDQDDEPKTAEQEIQPIIKQQQQSEILATDDESLTDTERPVREVYDEYEASVAMLEMEKRTLTQQLADAEVALEQAQQELAELKQQLEQARSKPPEPSAVEELGKEMKKQLESVQSLIEKLLNGTGENENYDPRQAQPL